MSIKHILPGDLGRVSLNRPDHGAISLTRLLWGIGALLLASAIPIYLQTASTSTPPAQLWRLLMASILVWWMPGALLILHIRPANLDAVTMCILAIGLGLGWMIVVALVVYLIPGPVAFWQLINAYEIGALILIVCLLMRRSVQVNCVRTPVWLYAGALLVIALLLRLPGLGYHEFHVDEVSVLYSASQAIAGNDQVLAEHTKGPGEILIVLVVYRLMGSMNELWGRLPFGLASVASILAVGLLGWRMFSGRVGLWAGVLMAANGFALGLSRIVQYQAPILLFSTLAVLAAWEFAQRSERKWMVLAIIFSTAGVILHYEFGLMAPLLLFLYGLGWRNTQPAQRRRLLWQTALAGSLALVLIAFCYVPILLNPQFTDTQSYLNNRLGSMLHFNLAFFIEMGTFYNSTYFFVGMTLLGGWGLVLTLRRCTVKGLALLLWAAPFLGLYLFILRFPGTHFYQLTPSWALAAAIPIGIILPNGFRNLRMGMSGMRWRWAAVTIFALWLGISVYYVNVVFFRQGQEYVANFPKTRMPFYWAPYGENIPQKPRFGFPIVNGWKVLGVLADWGYLQGTYTSNDRMRYLRRWYVEKLTRAEIRDFPDFVFVSQTPQEANPFFDDDFMEEHYRQIGEVRVGGEPRIAIWGLEPFPVPYVTFDAEEFAQLFEKNNVALEPTANGSRRIQNAHLGTDVELNSSAFSFLDAEQEHLLYVTLEWETAHKLTHDYKLFVHVVDANGQLVSQWDGKPGMNLVSTEQWQPAQPFIDHVLVRIPPDLASGSYRLLVGLYNEKSGERLGNEVVEIGRFVIS